MSYRGHRETNSDENNTAVATADRNITEMNTSITKLKAIHPVFPACEADAEVAENRFSGCINSRQVVRLYGALLIIITHNRTASCHTSIPKKTIDWFTEF